MRAEMKRVNNIQMRNSEFAEGNQYPCILEDQESSTQIHIFIERQFVSKQTIQWLIYVHILGNRYVWLLPRMYVNPFTNLLLRETSSPQWPQWTFFPFYWKQIFFHNISWFWFLPAFRFSPPPLPSIFILFLSFIRKTKSFQRIIMN